MRKYCEKYFLQMISISMSMPKQYPRWMCTFQVETICLRQEKLHIVRLKFILSNIIRCTYCYNKIWHNSFLVLLIYFWLVILFNEHKRKAKWKIWSMFSELHQFIPFNRNCTKWFLQPCKRDRLWNILNGIVRRKTKRKQNMWP